MERDTLPLNCNFPMYGSLQGLPEVISTHSTSGGNEQGMLGYR